MRRVILLLVVMATALVLASGLALAVNKIGTQGRDFLKGTGGADTVVGRGNEDCPGIVCAKVIIRTTTSTVARTNWASRAGLIL